MGWSDIYNFPSAATPDKRPVVLSMSKDAKAPPPDVNAVSIMENEPSGFTEYKIVELVEFFKLKNSLKN